MEDRKRQIDVDFTQEARKNMPRGKPQQELYKPGSGKLRRSTQGADDSMPNLSSNRAIKNNVASQETFATKAGNSTADYSAQKDLPKRLKKPERELYIPRVVAQSRELYSPQGFTQDTAMHNGSERSFESMNSSKRYSHRSQNLYMNTDEWRDKSPMGNRSARLGSEPRATNNGHNWQYRDRHRDRDTRSVEPSAMANRNHNSEKIQSKPPSGRRHSTIGGYEQEKKLKMIENLPPRLRKKYMEENGLTEEDLETSSSTFRSSVNSTNAGRGYHSLDYYNTLPNSSQHGFQPGLHSGYQTLPSRGRGRGRFSHHEQDWQPGRFGRSMTPDRASFPRSPANSRPSTPTRRYESRPQTPLSHGTYDVNDRNDSNRRNERHAPFPNDRNRNDDCNSNASRDKKSDYSVTNRNRRDNDKPKKGEEKQNRDDDRSRRNGDNDHKNRRVEQNQHRKSEGERNDQDRRDAYKGNDNRHRRRGGRERQSSTREFVGRSSNVSQAIAIEKVTENDHDKIDVKLSEIGGVTPSQKEDFKSNSETRLSPISPEEVVVSVEEKLVAKDEHKILDWNEEIELEEETLSDAMTRSSSMASLQDVSTRSMPTSANTTPSVRKSKKRSGKSGRQRNRRDSTASVESRDLFKVPQEYSRDRRGSRRHSRDGRAPSFEPFHSKSRNPSRDVSFDRSHQSTGPENWREEIIRSRQNSEHEVVHKKNLDRSRTNSEMDDISGEIKKAGILVLPPKSLELNPSLMQDWPKYPDIRKSPQQKTLFDPNNPKKPILVKSPGSRAAMPGFSTHNLDAPAPETSATDKFGNVRPSWYDESREEFKLCRYPDLLRDIKRADIELQDIIKDGMLLVNYETVDNLRQFLKNALEYLLLKALKFCQTENVELHLWNILYHNIIEITRKAITNEPESKPQYKAFLLYLIDEGTKYYERLVGLLEDKFQFKVANFIGNNSMVQHKGLGLVGLALISAQKIFMFLGDLGRYKEQVNETMNFGKSRQWYIKSHEINPKNGKPYLQLAVLAVRSRRKLDAVYYYMRSLMASNPVPSARESLIFLLDENRKKYLHQICYLQGEKKRHEERMERQRQYMKQKESEESGQPNFLRKETWIYPHGGRRLHRTTKALQEDVIESDEEDLASLSSVDVNKRFVISYLHVHGKLIMKTDVEDFQDGATQMLKEFRALLQHSPVPLPCNRFLQLFALNMYAIETTQLKDPQLDGYRSELQERALIVSLQMFNLILERCVSILQEHFANIKKQGDTGYTLDSLPYDVSILLPAIKIWCDWMLCHTPVWNPPPSTQDFKVGHSGDLWNRLGVLMNLLEKMDPDSSDIFVNEARENYEAVRLPEDAVLCGFTPLMFNERETTFASKSLDPELAQLRLRISKLLFFGTVYLCGLEPPVLKLEIEDGRRDYVSVVRCDRGRDSSPDDGSLTPSNDDVLLETFSGDEDAGNGEVIGDADAEVGDPVGGSVSQTCDAPSSEIRDLLTRKVELEKRKRIQELHRQRVMKILSQSVVSVHLEVRPKYLVPDTNCFIDHLDSIQTIAQSHTYTVMVPIIVLSELEGLSKGGVAAPSHVNFRVALNPEHVRRVAQSARAALEFFKKRHASVKCVTTRGTVLPSTTFSAEDDTSLDGSLTNDDKILTTCLGLCKGHHHQEGEDELANGEPRHIVREVVLLTEDRNLRVKAYARDVPVRELPDFMQWAGLG
ncbi:telomerase-binding protein EST1A isoform X2 [Cylas formicarius]|uniref:telomerase-binding protein EST1A isoform X2 n=1 Tax=Cylas formicarius TaxID=197179 RepID=UPI002958CEC2|nr:telomerase-binding protein EST1A isoform X2 [Cylas formicarius]